VPSAALRQAVPELDEGQEPWYFTFLFFFVFSLYERKNEEKKIVRYLAAVYPEPDEGQAKTTAARHNKSAREKRMPERIGMIGLGLMGKPMARNLLRAGFPVTVYNRSRPAIDELAAAGATPAGSPREVALHSDIVITMLPDSPNVEAVVLGAPSTGSGQSDGVLAGGRPGLLLIDMSTISPIAARAIAAALEQHGMRMLDAPVSGGDVGAINATLSIMVGGAAEDLQRARPVFEALGTTITHCGAIGSGQIVKACNQLVVALTLAATSEALVLGAKAGVQPEIILQVLGGGLAQNRVMDLRGPTMIKHHFEPGGKAKFHHKDLGIILQLARSHGVALPMTALVDQLFTALIEHGGGERDHSSLLTVLETLSNFSLAP
jgi:2-hydroxy-3-oxopropionate reductase